MSGPIRIGIEELPTSAGRVFGPAEPLEILQDRVNAFADVTGDRQWIHVDTSRAEDSPFGGLVAHGYLTLSLSSYFLPQLFVVDDAAAAINYGLNKVRFPAAVLVGSRLICTAEITEVVTLPNGYQVTTSAVLSVEGAEKPSCIAEQLTRYMR